MSTVKEIENIMHECAIRKAQMQELCRREDSDIFDIVYNIAKGYLEKDASDLMRNLQNAAIDGKRIDIDPTKSSYQKKQNFSVLYNEIEENFNELFRRFMRGLKP